jgi:hypothetical protein
VPQVNIYGVSYSTRLALEVMRSFPQQVRSVILDSVIPAQSRFFEDDSTAIARVYLTIVRPNQPVPGRIRSSKNASGPLSPKRRKSPWS